MRATILPLVLLFTWQPTVYGLQDSEIPTDIPVSALISSAKDHLAKGSPREALPFFDAAIARDPTNYLTIFQRGAAFLSLGRDSQATSDFDRVLELKPDFEGALLQRARIRTRAGDWLAAKHDLEAAGKRNTEEYRELEEARTASSVAAEAETKGDWETCINQASMAIIKASTALRLRQVRLRCRFERGEIQEAISDLSHVIQLSPSSLEPHLQIANMLFYSLGDTDRGVAQVRKCLHSDPDSKQCSRLFRRQKNLTKRLEKLLDLMEKKKYTNTASMLKGNTEETGLINDVKQDIAEARKEGYIHPKAPENLYIFLIETTCEAYRKVCTGFDLFFMVISTNHFLLAIDEYAKESPALLS
jgi:DnaJ homolog subfamily C member 3